MPCRERQEEITVSTLEPSNPYVLPAHERFTVTYPKIAFARRQFQLIILQVVISVSFS